MGVNGKTTTGNEGHRSRLHDRFDRDPLSLADYELLELLLGYAIPRRDTKPLAKDLLKNFSTIRGVFDARADELLQIAGFGQGTLRFWKVLREFFARHAASQMFDREVLSSPQSVATLAKARLAGMANEQCWIALVDAQNRLIAWQMLNAGSVGEVAAAPRQIFEAAILHKASGIILVHNHPGGSAKPSQADLALTAELQKLAKGMDIRFLDHIIVTEGDCYSITLGQTV